MSRAQVCSPGDLRKFDSNVAKLSMVGNSGRKFPENRGPELKKFCSENDKLISDVEKYRNQCLENMSKQVTGLLVFTARNQMKQFCRKNSKQLDTLLKIGACGNSGINKIDKCYTAMLDKLLGIQISQDDKKKIPWLCCSIYEIMGCMSGTLQGVDKCAPNTIDSMIMLFRAMSGNVIDVFCGDYTEGSDKCDSLEKPPKKLKTQRRPKSIAIPIVDVLKSFPEV